MVVNSFNGSNTNGFQEISFWTAVVKPKVYSSWTYKGLVKTRGKLNVCLKYQFNYHEKKFTQSKH